MSHAPDAISYPGKRPGLLVLDPSSLGCQKKNPPMRNVLSRTHLRQRGKYLVVLQLHLELRHPY